MFALEFGGKILENKVIFLNALNVRGTSTH